MASKPISTALAVRATLHPTNDNGPRTDWSDFLQTFSLTVEQNAHLEGLNDLCRNHEIELLLYAHIYREWCREQRVAILSSAAERVLQRYWAENREQLVADVTAPYFGKASAATGGLDTLAEQAIDTSKALRAANDDQWDRANDTAFDARSDFRACFFALTGLKPAQLAQLQMEGVL